MSDNRRPLEPENPTDETAIAIFDSRVDDLPILLAGLRPGVSAHILDPDRDGIEQISELIYQYPTAFLTLVAHGFPGGLQLGAGKLELGNVSDYSSHFQGWFRTADASQLNLLACHVAAGDGGTEFIEKLANLTGAEVRASTNIIGNGTWPTMATQTFRKTTLEQYGSTLVLTFKEDIKNSTFDGGDPNSNRLSGASGVAVSPDNSQIFVTSAVDSSITVFNRDTLGNITFSQVIRDGSDIGDISGSELLAGAFGVAVSPDGNHVFVASTGDDSLTIFRRENGVLREHQLLRNTRLDPNGKRISTLAGAIDVAVSADGNHVFVVSLTDSAITVFNRDASGTLTFRESIINGQKGANALREASGVAISPSGDQVFVTSHLDGAITIFNRDASGNLTFRQVIQDGTGAVQSLFGASSVAVSPDGNQVYVASATDAALTVFNRNADGTLSFAQVIQDGDGGAELFGGSSDLFAGTSITGFPAINGFSRVTVSADGRQVFVASFEENGLTVFDRDATGRLTFNQFIQDQDGRHGADELAGAVGVAVSSDGQQVFVTGFKDAALTAFNRDLAPSLLSIARQTPTTVTTNADSLVFRVTFNESILNIDAADFTITGGTTATITNVTAVSATAYDITISGGDLADFNGTVGLDLAPGQTITDPIGNALPTTEPDTDETYTLTNITTSTSAKLTPLSGLEVTSLGAANTVRLQVDQVNISDVGEILIFSVDRTDRTQIGNFSILEGGELPDVYAPSFSLDNSQVTEGQFLQFELVVNGVTHRATTTIISDTQVSLDFGEGTTLTAETFTQTTTTNLLVGDAIAIDLTDQIGLVNVEFTIYREAAMNNTIGFYTTTFADGGIQDTLTNNILRPGDTGYKAAALANQLSIKLQGENGQARTVSTELTGGGFLGTFLVADGDDPAVSDVYFSHAQANANNNDHAKLLGDNTFGYEDISGLGDQDFNDTIVQFAII